MKRILAIALLSAAAAHAEWQLPQGYGIEEYAREPRIVDPVAMDWDSRGRIHVLESSGRIKVFGDAEPQVLAEDLAGATGLAVRDGKIFVARAPELLMLDGTNRQVVLRDLPQPGARGNINSLRFGPDGWLYFAQGAQDEAEFYRFGTRTGNPQLISSGVARFHPETKRIEMVADGMVFPRGLAFNSAGELFAADSTWNHLFHVFHGVSYQRPLARDYLGYKPPPLGAIADHRFLEGEFFGMTIYRDMVLVPSLREKALHLERLEPHGSTYRARCEDYFLRRTEGEFQPVDLRDGPDGALWVLDRAGSDARNPFKPMGKGRIWRVTPPDAWKPAPRTNTLVTISNLAQTASHPDPAVRRQVAAMCRTLMLGSAAPGIPEPHSVTHTNLIDVVKTLIDASVRDADPAMEAVLWSVLEPLLAADATATFRMLTTLEARDTPAACTLFQDSIRRAYSASYEDHLPSIYPLLAQLGPQSVPMCLAGLEAVIKGQKTSKRYHRFEKSLRKLITALQETQQPELIAGGLQAGALCGYADSRAEIVKRMLDADRTEAERIQAVQFAQVLRDEPAREALVQLLEKPTVPNVTLAAAYSLKEIGQPADVDIILRAATKQPPEIRTALGKTIAERRDWMSALGMQVRARRLDPATLPEPVRQKLQ
jgi:glucose/arabinose dehydrogenase